MGPKRCRPRSTRRANPGWVVASLSRSARIATTTARAQCPLGEGGEEPGSFAGVAAQRHRLFALVDDQHLIRPRIADGGEGVHRMGARRDDHHLATVAGQGCGHARSHQGRLAAARRPHHGQYPDRGQSAQALDDLGVAAEECVGVAHVVGDETRVRADGRRFGAGLVRDQGGVLAQNGLFEGDQVRTGVDPQLGGQHRPGAVQGPQRLALAAGLVLGGREDGPPPLPQRSLGHFGLGLAQHLAEAARPQRGVEAELLGVETQLLEARSLDLSRVPPVEITQGTAPPQPQRLTSKVRGAFRLAQRQQLVRTAHQAFEPPGVDLVTGNNQPIPVGHGLDGFGAQHPPKPHHTAGYHLPP